MRPLLSICVPTFSRGEVVYKTILDHLSIEDDRIEVIVCDNDSPDNTIVLLSNISDNRFRLYKNDKNMGFAYNLARVVKEATGHFACIMSDEDTLNKGAIKNVLDWLMDFIENNMNIAVVIPDFHSNLYTITKQDELLNVLYGRVSYISGLIINRDKLEDKDFVISSENYYPHIQLILNAGIKGRVIYSALSLYERTYEEETHLDDPIDFEKNNKKLNKEAYIEPNRRLRQFELESKMILELDVNKKLKWKLLTKQYHLKHLQATIIYELIIRNEKLCERSPNRHTINTAGIDEKFNEAYMDRIINYIGEEYLQAATDEAHAATNYIRTVQRIRNDFDILINEKGYPGVLVGSIPFIQKNVDTLLDYGFNISFVCTNDETEEELGNRWLRIEDLKKFNKVALIIDENNTTYIEALNNIEIEEAHLFHINDFRIRL